VKPVPTPPEYQPDDIHQRLDAVLFAMHDMPVIAESASFFLQCAARAAIPQCSCDELKLEANMQRMREQTVVGVRPLLSVCVGMQGCMQ
jgi:imidazoleglycerol phosphate synthase glutamine amidotransferase subunit HisH